MTPLNQTIHYIPVILRIALDLKLSNFSMLAGISELMTND